MLLSQRLPKPPGLRLAQSPMQLPVHSPPTPLRHKCIQDYGNDQRRTIKKIRRMLATAPASGLPTIKKEVCARNTVAVPKLKEQTWASGAYHKANGFGSFRYLFGKIGEKALPVSTQTTRIGEVLLTSPICCYPQKSECEKRSSSGGVVRRFPPIRWYSGSPRRPNRRGVNGVSTGPPGTGPGRHPGPTSGSGL